MAGAGIKRIKAVREPLACSCGIFLAIIRNLDALLSAKESHWKVLSRKVI